MPFPHNLWIPHVGGLFVSSYLSIWFLFNKITCSGFLSLFFFRRITSSGFFSFVFVLRNSYGFYLKNLLLLIWVFLILWDFVWESLKAVVMSHSSSDPPYCCSSASPELKLYQAFIFSVPIFFTFILLLLFYLFYLRRRRVDWSSLRMRTPYLDRGVTSSSAVCLFPIVVSSFPAFTLLLIFFSVQFRRQNRV